MAKKNVVMVVMITPLHLLQLHTQAVFFVKNNLGYSILNITVKHTTSAYGVESSYFENIPAGGVTSGTSFKYQTGAFSSFDYWFVDGVAAHGPGVAYFRTKDNFYCSLSSDDNGNAYLEIQGDRDSYPSHLHVYFSNSSDCNTNFV